MIESVTFLQIMLTLAGLFLTVVLAMIGWGIVIILSNVKTLRTAQEQRINNLESAIKEIRGDFSNHKTQIHETYVRRDDYIRSISSLDQKMVNLGTAFGSLKVDVVELMATNQKEVVELVTTSQKEKGV